MNKQMNLSFINDELKEVKTHKREFLEQIERIMPWGELEELVRPCYYEGKRGNKPYDLERMLRIYLVQNLYNLSDMATVTEVIDSRAFSDFCGVESSNRKTRDRGLQKQTAKVNILLALANLILADRPGLTA